MASAFLLGCVLLNTVFGIAEYETVYISVGGSRVKRTTTQDIRRPDSLVIQLLTEGNQTFRHLVHVCRSCTQEIPIHIISESGARSTRHFHVGEDEGHFTSRNAVYKVKFNGGSVIKVDGFFKSGDRTFCVESLRAGHTLSRCKSIYEQVTATFSRESFIDTTADSQEPERLSRPDVSGTFRHKRHTQLYEIELFIAVEYSFYKEWLERHASLSTNTSVILNEIVHHYVMLINGVTARFTALQSSRYTVGIRLTGIYVAQKPADSSWSENIKQSASPRAVISEQSLKLFAEWLKRNPDVTSHHDHAFVFTSYDLMSKENKKTLGLGYKQSMCSEKSVSMIEHHGNVAYTSFIAAHELAHSLGAKHDGYPATVTYGDTTHTCSSDGGYIMSAKATKSPDDDTRAWDFSKCSLLYFDFFIDHLNAQRSNCLLWSAFDNNTPTTVSRDTHVYSPDEQCQHANGEGSFMLREVVGANVGQLCHSIPCYDPGGSTLVLNTLTLEGTQCGAQKVCHLGQCAIDTAAIIRSDSEPIDNACLFGDQPGVITDDKACPELISGPDKASLCYTYHQQCCFTCAKYRRHNVLGDLFRACEYGDRKTPCLASDCSSQRCCETCAVGDGTLKVCSALAPPVQGLVTYNTISLQHGTRATFSCFHGYQILGVAQIACLENGTWSHTSPVCFKGCLRPVKTLYVDLSSDNVTYDVGTVITARCLHGLQLKGESTLLCSENSTWSAQPYCELGITSPSTIHTKENKKEGSVIHILKSDKAHAQYELLYRSHPGIDVTSSGSVFVESGSLDYEITQTMTLVVEAKLTIDPRFRARHRLTVKIEDENEFEPTFPVNYKCCSVSVPPSPDISIGVIARMSAKDDDRSGNAITFNLRGDTEAFRIDENSGEITFVNDSYYRHPVNTKFNMVVFATDSGSPRRTGSCKVEVIIGNECSSLSLITSHFMSIFLPLVQVGISYVLCW